MVLNGTYELLHPVGFGGQGQLWHGTDLRTTQPVAIKVFPPTADQRRPLRELEVLSELPPHPRVATIHGSGEEHGQLYLVMGWIEGKSLEHILAREPQPWHARVLIWAKQACVALAHVHRHKIIHRDVKPANLMITPAEDVTLIDFGISRFTTSTLTQGEIVGSLPYLAPERWREDPGDYRVDLYSLGCVLYEMLTGEPPFGRKRSSLEEAHLRRSPTPPTRLVHGIPPDLEELTLQLLAKIPAQRPENAGEVAARLAAIIDSASSTDEIQSSDEQVRRLTADLGPEDPSTLEARLRRAKAIAEGGDMAGAARECDRVAAQYEQMFGPFHPLTMKAREAKFRLTAPRS
jgi:serine/threonine-protein kinase